MSKKAFDQKLAQLDAARADPASPASREILRASLRGPGYLAGKAASILARAGILDMVPELLAAFDRLLVNPVKSDPQCWGKSAIAKALKDLGYAESAVFLRGVAHVQMEPVWGGQEDTAATLRGACLLALLACPDLPHLDLLRHCADALADAKSTVRMDAVRAIGHLGSEEGTLLLRLKALSGDSEIEITGACLAALLQMRAPGAVPFAARFLKSEDAGLRSEAAAALGESRNPEAFAVLKQAWETTRNGEFRDTLLSAIAVSRIEEAIAFLIGLVGQSAHAESALLALVPHRFSSDLRERIRAAVERTGSDLLQDLFEDRFRPDT